MLGAVLARFERLYEGYTQADYIAAYIAGLDAQGAWEVMASRPDLFTYLPYRGQGDRHRWVRTGSRHDPRHLIRALDDADGGLSVSALADRLGREKSAVLDLLHNLGPQVRSVGIGPPLWHLTRPAEEVLAALDRAPANPYPVPRWSPPPPPAPLSPAQVRQKMLDQIPDYRLRLAALDEAGFARPDNQDRLAQAHRAMAALDARFTPERFRDLGSLVRALEKDLKREQQPVPTQPTLPTSQAQPRRVGTSRGVPRDHTPYRGPWR